MKYITYKHTKKGNNQSLRFNAFMIATRGKGSRCSLSNYRKAYDLAYWLKELNRLADYVAEYDNDSRRYNHETSQRLNKRLEDRAERVEKGLKAFGLCFYNSSHYYEIAKIGTHSNIYLKD